ncbi:MAG: PHB depolymerase family esterase [Pseudomonadota bacterium]
MAVPIARQLAALRRLLIHSIGVALLALAAGSVAADTRGLEHQGEKRRFLLHNGAAAAQAPMPLVVALHGYRSKEKVLAAGDDLSSLRWDPLDALASREGFLVAYPAALLGQWNLFEGLRDTTLDDGRPLDDVGFILAVIARLVDDGLADPRRVYLTGFWDGAIMSYRLLCLAESPFAAAAPMGGTMAQTHRDACAAEAPSPVMVIAGTNDLILPYDGWIFYAGREVSIPETMEHFRLLHGCSGQESELRPDRNTNDNSRVREVRWTGCARDGAVVLLRVEGGGHTMPSYEPVPEAWIEKGGGHNQDIEAVEEAWRFFGRFTRESGE